MRNRATINPNRLAARLPHLFLLVCTALIVTACQGSRPQPLPRVSRKYTQPTVAVLNFENKAWFPLDWNLGGGVRDMLVNELVRSRRFSVVTREDLAVLVQELEVQRKPQFRPHGKVEYGRLKNVQFLIKGAVTEFNHVAEGSLRAWFPQFLFRGKGSYAIVGITMYVIDVESGEIIASTSLERKVYAGSAEFSGIYRKTILGGEAFYRTPLGRATKKVMRKALKELSQSIACAPWHPQIAGSSENMLLITGGIDRKLKPGTTWELYTPGEKIVNPQNGDCIGTGPPTLTGKVIITRVHARHSEATLLQGTSTTGQFLRRVNQINQSGISGTKSSAMAALDAETMSTTASTAGEPCPGAANPN